jgi:glycerol-3-phosphate dehydrogenase
MASTEHDVVVIGGGVHGACAAWEAARRGLRVALVEAADFGHATSSNSLRTFHGGIRYLQQLDFQRMRESIRERREWLRLAPHLVQPMRFVLPTTGRGMRGPAVLDAALVANDLMSADRNRGVRGDKALPRGELWSASRARQVFDGTAVEGLNGAAAWYDAVCSNTERLLISIVAAAVAEGAQVANYARVVSLKRRAGAICGVRVCDEIDGATYDLRTQVVINAAGPWVDETLQLGALNRRAARNEESEPRDDTPSRPATEGSYSKSHLFAASKAFNLLTRALPFTDAIGLTCPRRDGGEGADTYFVIPWNGRALIGTRHLRCDPRTHTCAIAPAEVQAFLGDINPVLGRFRLTTSDVLGVFCGLLPEHEEHTGTDVALVKTARVIDHGLDDGVSGLFSIVGIKWTTARAVAERAVVMACERLAAPATVPADRPRTLFRRSADAAPRKNLASDARHHLEQIYGPDTTAVEEIVAAGTALNERVVPDMPVMKAQVVHATRVEMARNLSDVVRRRLPLYLSQQLDERALATCASLMQRELNWTATEVSRQIADAAAQLQAFRCLGERDELRAAVSRPAPAARTPLPMSPTGA